MFRFEVRNAARAIVGVIAFAIVLVQAPAQAQDESGSYMEGIVFFVFGSLPVGIASTALLVKSTSLAVQGSWLPPKAAIFELCGGALPNMLLGVFWSTREGVEFHSTLAIAHLALGSAFLAHGLLSLYLYEAPLTQQYDRGAFSSVSLGVMPTQGGALGSIGFRF